MEVINFDEVLSSSILTHVFSNEFCEFQGFLTTEHRDQILQIENLLSAKAHTVYLCWRHGFYFLERPGVECTFSDIKIKAADRQVRGNTKQYYSANTPLRRN